MLLNALDFATVQDALDYARPGDRVYLPGVKTYSAPSSGWRLRRSIELFGDGPGNPSGYEGTVLTPAGAGNDVLVVDPEAARLEGLHIHDLRIKRRSTEVGPDGRDGIRFVSDDTPNTKLSEVRIERVAISDLGGIGIRLVGGGSEPEDVVSVSISDCDITNCTGGGVRLEACFTIFVRATRVASNGAEGIYASNTELAVQGVSFDGNCLTGGASDLVLQRCGQATIAGSRFANFALGLPRRACFIADCAGGFIEACTFEVAVLSPGDVGMEIALGADAIGGAFAILPNRFTRVGTAIRIQSSVSHCYLMPQFSDPDPATISLPGGADDVTIALPSQNRPSQNSLSGVLVPVLKSAAPKPDPQDPRGTSQRGSLLFQNDQLWVVTGSGAAQWAAISTQVYP